MKLVLNKEEVEKILTAYAHKTFYTSPSESSYKVEIQSYRNEDYVTITENPKEDKPDIKLEYTPEEPINLENIDF